MEKVGIIAGGGQFPVLLCRAARAQGREVVVLALEGEADPALKAEASRLVPFKLGQLGRIINSFKESGVSRVVMAGSVAKPRLFSGGLRPDAKLISLLPKVKHLRLHDDGLLRTLAQVLAGEGLTVVDSTFLLPELRTPAGVLSRRKPTRRERGDAEYGFRLAKELGRFDIGQCLVVRQKAVLAVEAMEGTDETIRRGGALGGGRATVIKVAKPGQDLRFDLPSVGLTTIQTMALSGCSSLVLEAGRTLTFDREAMLALADKKGIAVLALEGEGS